MSATNPETIYHDIRAVELRKLPAFERDVILSDAAEIAYCDYSTDDSLNESEAYSPEDLNGCSDNTQSR